MEKVKRRNRKIGGILGIILAVFILIGSVGVLFSTFKNIEDENYSYSNPVSTVFAENSWKTIAKVFKSGKAAKYWNLGDTKEISFIHGYTYEVQIVDMTPNRYALSDGSGYSNGVLQFVQCVATDRSMNESATNEGGFTDSLVRTVLNDTVYNQLPNDLKAVISEVSIASGIGGGATSGITESDNKLFFASEYEIFGETTYSIGDSEGQPQFGYYALHNSNADRIKTQVSNGSATRWWLRSPFLGNSSHFCAVSLDGGAERYFASYVYGVCPCFAF